MNTRVKPINIFTSAPIFAIAFSLPFTIFCFQWGAGGESKLEPAHFFALVLIVASIMEGARRSTFKGFAASEKAMLLCLAVAFASFISAQISYGWQGQLHKGAKQLIGLSFMVIFFLTVRRHVDSQRILIGVVTWIWRGALVLALLGIWQSIAVNLLDVYFLADWEWVDKLLGHTFPFWQNKLDYFGPILRANSFSAEPSFYCHYLLAGMGLAVFRLFPPPFIRRTPWKAQLPSLAIAGAYFVAYLLSFSLMGVIGLGIALLSYFIILKRINFKSLMIIVIIIVSVFSSWNYFTEGLLIKKLASLNEILPNESKETNDASVPALILAMNLEVTLAGLRQNPFLGWGVGGHPDAVEREFPGWFWTSDLRFNEEFNADDSASLALRLLSEMGLLGFLIFTGTFGLIIWQAVRAIQGAIKDPATWEVLPFCIAVTVGAISLVAVFLMRNGSYFSMTFWFLLALTSVVPQILKNLVANSPVPYRRTDRNHYQHL